MSFKRIYKSAKSELIEHKKTRIISIILIIVFGVYQFFVNVITYDGNSFSVNYVPFCMLLFILFVICKNLFKDMYDNTAADVQMSLPISSRERYFSHLLTAGLVFEFPFIIISVFSNIVSFLYIRYCYLKGVNSIVYNYSRYLWSGSEMPVFSDFIKYELILIAVSLFVIAVTAFGISCIGAKSEALYIPILLVLVFSLFPILFFEFVTSKFLVFSANIDNIRILKMIPGFTILFFDFEELKFADIIINIILSLVVLLLGLFAFEKRDVKSVGKPVVNRVFYEFLLFLSSVIIFIASLSGDETLFVMVNIIGIIGMSILRILGSRKEFHVTLLLKWTGIYILYFIGFVLLMFAACKTNLFGCAEKCFKDNYYDSEYSCEISTYYNENTSSYRDTDYYYYGNYRRSSYSEDNYTDEEFKSEFPGVERQIITLNNYEGKSKELSKLFAKYNYISINKPGYFAYQMFFKNSKINNGICSVDFYLYNYMKAYNGHHYLNFNSLYLTEEEYKQLNAELASLAR